MSGSQKLSGSNEILNLKGCSELWCPGLCYQKQKRNIVKQFLPELRPSCLNIYLAIFLEDLMDDELVLDSLLALIKKKKIRVLDFFFLKAKKVFQS